MKNINALKSILNVTTVNFVLLTILTCGVYPCALFMYKNREMKEVLGVELLPFQLLLRVICIVGGFEILALVTEILDIAQGDLADGLYTLTDYVDTGCWIYIAFKMKEVLNVYVAKTFKFDLKANGFLTFIFGAAYIVYLINNLEKRQAYHEALFGTSEQKESVDLNKTETH